MPLKNDRIPAPHGWDRSRRLYLGELGLQQTFRQMIEHYADPLAGVKFAVGDQPDWKRNRFDIGKGRNDLGKPGSDFIRHDGQAEALADEFPGDHSAGGAKANIGLGHLQTEGAQVADQLFVVVEADKIEIWCIVPRQGAAELFNQ